jgi:hypothetical protein
LIRVQVYDDYIVEDVLKIIFQVSEFPEAKWAVAKMAGTLDDKRVAAVNVGTVHDEQKLFDAFTEGKRDYYAQQYDVLVSVCLEEFWTRVDRANLAFNFDTWDAPLLYAMHESGMLAKVDVSDTRVDWQSIKDIATVRRVDHSTIVFHNNSPVRVSGKRKDVDGQEAGGRIRRGRSSLVELKAKEMDLLEQLQSVRNEITEAKGTADVSDDSDGDR